MNVRNLDPESLFWRQIESQPGESLPRLLYADWCDENDRPVMAIVQRWLAATGRRPDPWPMDCWRWVSEIQAVANPVPKTATLPDLLFQRIGPGSRGPEDWSELGRCYFHTQREAEEFLAEGWDEATLNGTFRPDWNPIFNSSPPSIGSFQLVESIYPDDLSGRRRRFRFRFSRWFWIVIAASLVVGTVRNLFRTSDFSPSAVWDSIEPDRNAATSETSNVGEKRKGR